MKKTRRLSLILLPVSVLMLTLLVYAVNASSGSFEIEPMQKTVEKVDLDVSNQVVGNLSVSGGCIDFFINDPFHASE